MRAVIVRLIWTQGARQHPLTPSSAASVYWPVVHFEEEPAGSKPSWSVEITALTVMSESLQQDAIMQYTSEAAPEQYLVFGARFELMEGPNVVARGVVIDLEVEDYLCRESS